MARGRKAGPAVKVITSRDKELMEGIARTGLTTKYNARETIGLGEDRLRKLEKEGYIQSKNVVINNGKDVATVYYLNDKGKSYVKENSDIDHFYRSNERQIEHDMKLSEIYYSLDREIRATWKNENDLIKEYKELHPGEKLNTMVDATVEMNGVSVAVEVLTDNYGKQEIIEKMEIAEAIGCKEVISINV